MFEIKFTNCELQDIYFEAETRSENEDNTYGEYEELVSKLYN